jgi:hypothetical protein
MRIEIRLLKQAEAHAEYLLITCRELCSMLVKENITKCRELPSTFYILPSD